VKVQVFQQHLG